MEGDAFALPVGDMGAPGGTVVNDSSRWTNRGFFSAIGIPNWLLAGPNECVFL